MKLPTSVLSVNMEIPVMELPQLPLNPALVAVAANKDRLVQLVPLETTVKPDWMDIMDMTANMDVTDKFSAAPFHKNLASSVHLDLPVHKDNQETKVPEDPRAKMERMVKMATQDHKEWPVPLEIRVLLGHPVSQGQKVNLAVLTKSMDPQDHTGLLDPLVALDQKVFPDPMASPDLLAPQGHLVMPELPDQKAFLVPLVPQDKVARTVKLELVTTARPRERHQDIRSFRQNGKHSETLILGALFLQETVLFDNAQFLCFIFFVLWHTTR